MIRYISIDIETTGLSPKNCQVLEIGAVDSLTGKTFHCYVWHDAYWGESYAIAMNARIFEQLKRFDSLFGVTVAADGVRVYSNIAVGDAFRRWLNELGIEKPILAGKNVGTFDLRFLELLTDWPKCHHRVIDPAMLYLVASDEVPPGLEECMKRAGISGVVTHNALEDAILVDRVVKARLGS